MAGWMPVASVIAVKRLGRDDIVPDWGTLTVHPSGHDSYTRRDWPVGSMLAIWDHTDHRSDLLVEARMRLPDELWVRVPTGRVPVDLRRAAWNGR